MSVLNEAKKLEEFRLVFLGYANACINNWDLDESVLILVNDLYSDSYFAFLSEFEGVGLEAKKHLHDPLFVWFYNWAVLKRTLAFSNIDKLRVEFYALLLSSLSLDTHYLLDAIFDIESLHHLSELVCPNLSIIKEILHHETHYIGRWLLNLESVL
jgi:hypothetical protein